MRETRATLRPMRAATLRAAIWLAAATSMSCGREETGTQQLSAGGGAAEGLAPEVVARSLLLVSLDTTRADRIGAYGHASAHTPAIDRLAREGLLFLQAYAPVPVTLPSHASLLTGVYPPAHGVQDNAIFKLVPEARVLAEVFAERGFRTGAFVGSLVLDSPYGLDQGFEIYRSPMAANLGDSPELVERRAEEVVDDASAWLATVQPDERFFAWVHFYDPHYRYDPPERFRRLVPDAYDGEIAYCDEQLGRLLRVLAERGLDRELAVIITADHGESLGEHGEGTHGVFLYEAATRVPLIVHVPGAPFGSGRRIPHPVSIVDVVPTVLEILGIPRAAMPDVRVPSLLASVQGDASAASERAVYMETFMPYHAYRWHPARALVWNGYKLIEGRAPELYALGDDPEEADDRVERKPDRLARMRERLQSLLAEHAPLGWDEARVLDESERARLEALGYTGSARASDAIDASLPDPRERIGDIKVREKMREYMMEGVRLLRLVAEGRSSPGRTRADQELEAARLLERARETLDELRRLNPLDPSLDATLGSLETARGRWDEAIPALERAILSQPTIPNNHYNLAVCYMQVGKAVWAIREMEKAISCEPTFLRATLWLVQACFERREYGRAAWWLEEYERRWKGPERELERVRELMRQARVGMEKARQQVAPPAEFPVKDLVPEGVRARTH
ncbi:MAG: sulfatase-like hydrolase/transferase [Planctomycetota bacterium]